MSHGRLGKRGPIAVGLSFLPSGGVFPEAPLSASVPPQRPLRILIGMQQSDHHGDDRADSRTTELSIIVPTRDEAANIAELVERIAAAVDVERTEVVFVDDSEDATPRVIRAVAETAPLPVRLVHRASPVDGLGGAVAEGLRLARADACLVMDGDLQHPPEAIPRLAERFGRGDADVIVATRYADEGEAGGLADARRVLVSRGSTRLAKTLFPKRLAEVSDPMTGFFLVDRRALDLDSLRPRGFKILLEILARHELHVAEIPFRFEGRRSGESKASHRQGARFLAQLARLRFGRMSRFAVIGALGAVANLALMQALMAVGVEYLVAAVIAAEATIVGNFALQERFVFRDLRAGASGAAARFAKSFAFNNAEALVRIPLLAVMVEGWHVSSLLAAAVTLAGAFVVRFLFHSLVVYAPVRREGSLVYDTSRGAASRAADANVGAGAHANSDADAGSPRSARALAPSSRRPEADAA